MNEKELTKDESLALITEMIVQAKHNIVRSGSFYFLLWGWVVLFGNLGHYALATFTDYGAPYIVWIVTIPAAIISMIYGARQDRSALVKGHLDRVYGLVWLAVVIGALVVLIFGTNSGLEINPIILSFAGVGTFISGVLLRFRPLILGGFALWIASIVAYGMDPITANLAGAAGILAGYLVPGYLLKKAESERI